MTRRPPALTLLTACALALLAAAGCSPTATPVAATAPPAMPDTAVASAPAGAAAPQVADIDVTEHVKTALVSSSLLKGLDIAVVTINGDVRLTGLLDNQAQIDEALRIARAADGAHAIHDELTIRKQAALPHGVPAGWPGQACWHGSGPDRWVRGWSPGRSTGLALTPVFV